MNSATSYGSPEVSARNAQLFGHDHLAVSAVMVAEDQRTARCGRWQRPTLDAYFTLQHLPHDAEWAAPAPPDRPRQLFVPERKGAGDTKQRLNFTNQKVGAESPLVGISNQLALIAETGLMAIMCSINHATAQPRCQSRDS